MKRHIELTASDEESIKQGWMRVLAYLDVKPSWRGVLKTPKILQALEEEVRKWKDSGTENEQGPRFFHYMVGQFFVWEHKWRWVRRAAGTHDAWFVVVDPKQRAYLNTYHHMLWLWQAESATVADLLRLADEARLAGIEPDSWKEILVPSKAAGGTAGATIQAAATEPKHWPKSWIGNLVVPCGEDGWIQAELRLDGDLADSHRRNWALIEDNWPEIWVEVRQTLDQELPTIDLPTDLSRLQVTLQIGVPSGAFDDQSSWDLGVKLGKAPILHIPFRGLQIDPAEMQFIY